MNECFSQRILDGVLILMDNPKVFISYSQDSDEHSMWVLQLAANLRSHGVDVIFDQFDLRLGKDLRFFMENGLSSSSLVLCVCSENYVFKVDNGKGGAGYEGALMTTGLLSNVDQEYIIPIIRGNKNSENKMPKAFVCRKYIDFDNGDYYEKYEELLSRIYGEDLKKKPPLGNNPFSNEMGRRIDIKTKIESIKYQSALMDNHIVFNFSNNNGIFTIGTGEYEFQTKWSRAGNDSIHAYGKIGFCSGVNEFPEFEKISLFDFSSYSRTVHKGQIVVFENDYAHFAAVKVGNVKSSNHGYEDDEIEFDYHIYSGI